MFQPLFLTSLAVACTHLSVAHAQDAKKAQTSDIKPALSSIPAAEIDAEQMRLAKLIHKRITDYQQIKKETHNNKEEAFVAFKETMKTGAQFEMLPIKTKPFMWQGEKKEDKLEVTLSDFWMAKTEVTWELYEPFMQSELPRQKDGQVLDFLREQIKNDIDFLGRPTPPYHPMTYGMERDGHPAISMTQHAANKFCQWLSYQTGHFYRLPTEAEWEYACRGNSEKKYSWGDSADDAKNVAHFDGDANSHYNKPGQKKTNGFGLLDMHGNVAEWTLDQYIPDRKAYFGKDKVTNPWVKATKPYPHVVKGGHWTQALEQIIASARQQSAPQWKKTDPQNPKSQWYLSDAKFLGFRIVRPAKIPTAKEMYHYWNSGVAEDGDMAVNR